MENQDRQDQEFGENIGSKSEYELSSLEMLLMGITPLPTSSAEPLHSGSSCPGCGRGRLDYNGLLQLECPSCGFVSSEGAGCT